MIAWLKGRLRHREARFRHLGIRPGELLHLDTKKLGRIDGVVCDDPTAAQYALQKKEYAARLKIAAVLETGEWWDESKLVRVRRRLSDLGVFGAVRVTRATPDPERGTIAAAAIRNAAAERSPGTSSATGSSAAGPRTRRLTKRKVVPVPSAAPSATFVRRSKMDSTVFASGWRT